MDIKKTLEQLIVKVNVILVKRLEQLIVKENSILVNIVKKLHQSIIKINSILVNVVKKLEQLNLKNKLLIVVIVLLIIPISSFIFQIEEEITTTKITKQIVKTDKNNNTKKTKVNKTKTNKVNKTKINKTKVNKIIVKNTSMPIGVFTKNEITNQQWLSSFKGNKSEKEIFWRTMSVLELEKFIEAKVDLNKRDEQDLTALHLAAAYSQDIEVISTLVNSGLDINIKGEYTATPLHFACSLNSDEYIIKQLLKLNADVNAIDLERRTPLHWLMKFATNVDVIEVLLDDININIKAKDIYGQTALDIIKDNKELLIKDREKVIRWLEDKLELKNKDNYNTRHDN